MLIVENFKFFCGFVLISSIGWYGGTFDVKFDRKFYGKFLIWQAKNTGRSYCKNKGSVGRAKTKGSLHVSKTSEN